MTNSIFNGVENIVVKEDNASYLHFFKHFFFLGSG